MKIIIATPLFPPEIAEPAPYVKNLASKLSNEHKIAIVAYANFVEKIKEVKIKKTTKKQLLLLRLLKYTYLLLKESAGADIIYSQNAVASGFPAIIVGFLRRKPVIVRFLSDESWERSKQLKLTRKNLKNFFKKPPKNLKIRLLIPLQRFVLKRSKKIFAPTEELRKTLIEKYKQSILLNASSKNQAPRLSRT